MREFDLIVIGAGPGGYTGAIRAAQLGLSTAVIEKDSSLGGTCLNVGCIPSKALLESSEHYEFLKKDILKHGIKISGSKLDLQLMMKRKTDVVGELTKGIEFLLKKNKITHYRGFGRIKSANEVELNSEKETLVLKTKNVLLACGSIPIELPFAKWDKEVIVSSTEALSFPSVPKKLIIIGGGYIGLELGSVWSRLGSQVIVIERSSHICEGMDEEIRKKFLKILTSQGLEFQLQSEVTSIEKKGKKGEISFKDLTGQIQKVSGDKILVCVGRKPFTKNLGLENAGITLNSLGQVEVDSHFRANRKNIYAIGDLIKGPMLAHKAEEEGVAVAEAIATNWGHVNYDTVPSVIYTSPEVAAVGKTEQELKKENIPYNKGTFLFLANGRAKSMGLTEGMTKILSHKETDKILGVHILGPRAGDLISEAIVTMEFGGSSEDLARSFHAHPTLSEALREAALAVNKRVRQI